MSQMANRDDPISNVERKPNVERKTSVDPKPNFDPKTSFDPKTGPDQAASPSWPLRLGCPVWSCPHWAGQVYPPRTGRSDWLAWYSRTFNTVEGNSTFYALPPIETAKKWAQQAAPGFRFSFKFPRLISHELALGGDDGPTRDWLDFLTPLAQADRLGPTFLQLGPDFGPQRYEVLQRYLNRLPRDFAWAVELRHFDWFDSADNESRVDDLLASLNIDKVLFDSRPLYQSPPDDPIERASQSRKPKTPIRETVTGKHPLLRIVGRNRTELADAYFDRWAPVIADWIGRGLCPYVFTHAPDDALAPKLARRLADRMKREMPDRDWTVATPPMPAKQLTFLGDD